MVELTSGVALWYRGGYPSVHMRWVVVRHLEEPLGPYALLCTDSEAVKGVDNTYHCGGGMLYHLGDA